MLHKTTGLVLRYVKYGDFSIIVTIYTDKFGISTFVVNGVRSTRSKGKIALYQPMNLLELVVYQKVGRDINRISEVKSLSPLTSIRSDIRKSSIAIFLNEVLNKCLREESANEILFLFLKESILELDDLLENYQNFHLIFLLKLSGFLGFSPMSAEDVLTDSDGSMMPIDKEHKTHLNQLITADYSTELHINQTMRRDLLEMIIRFYKSHIELPDLKSAEVLHTVLHQ